MGGTSGLRCRQRRVQRQLLFRLREPDSRRVDAFRARFGYAIIGGNSSRLDTYLPICLSTNVVSCVVRASEFAITIVRVARWTCVRFE